MKILFHFKFYIEILSLFFIYFFILFLRNPNMDGLFTCELVSLRNAHFPL